MKAHRVLLIGNPNAGKTMLFNQLTGLNAHVANYPGITVEYLRGHLNLPSGTRCEVIDLPGTYSLHARSEDEALAVKGALGQLEDTSHDCLIAIVDATQMKRNLYLVAQLLELNRPLIVALTMMDVARKKNIEINTALLSRRLGVPVIPVSSVTQEGLLTLKQSIDDFFAQKPVPKMSSVEPKAITPAHIQNRYEQIHLWLDGIYTKPLEKRSFSIDDIALHPVFGPLFLLLTFALLFEILFVGSRPIIDGIDNLFSFLSQFLETLLPQGSLFSSLVVNGIVAGVGSVVTFVPLIAILFFFIGLLEDSGYMARATFLLDRLMSKVGLPGRAFVPLVSAFACAVPAILSTRVIESKKDRLLTILVTPLISCSARLPLYGLLIAALFSTLPPLWGFIPVGALVMLSMYSLGVVAVFIMAAIFKKTLLRGKAPTLILELPPYRLPRWGSLFRNVRSRVHLFLHEAGTVILALTIILWALFTFPQSLPNTTPDAHLKNSYAGQLGQWIEPAISPLGFDWKIGVGILASFAAREVFVSTLGVVYGLKHEQNPTSPTLREAISQDVNPRTGKPVYTPLVALSLMIFFALAMQCMSTLATVKKETKSWLWPCFQFGYMTALAWISSFTVFQIGSYLGF